MEIAIILMIIGLVSMFVIFACASLYNKRKRRQGPLFSPPVVVASQQMSTHPTHPVQFQVGPGNTFQPNPSAPYPQTYQIHMPMAPNQQYPQPYQNVYPQQPPPYPGIPQQQPQNQPDNQGGFKIGVETFSSATTGRNYEDSRNTARY